jgi:hypothetical protein
MTRIAQTFSPRPSILFAVKLARRQSRQLFLWSLACALCWTLEGAAVEYQVTELPGVISVPQNGAGLLSNSGRVGFNDYGQKINGGGSVSQLFTPTVPNGSTFITTTLATVDQSDFTAPLGLSNNGEVVGDYNPGEESAFAWIPTSPNATTGQFYIPNLNTNFSSIAYGVNNAAQIVGMGDGKAFLFTPTGIQFGQLMGTTTYLNTSGTAYGINALGQVVGANSDGTAFLFTPTVPNGTTGNSISLGSLPGATSMAAKAVNDAGAVVGSGAFPGIGNSLGFLWTNSGGLMNLNNLLDPVTGAGWTIQIPLAMNNTGQIAGNGLLNGVPAGFLLTPVPEPSTIALSTLAVLFLGNRRCRRSSRRCD